MMFPIRQAGNKRVAHLLDQPRRGRSDLLDPHSDSRGLQGDGGYPLRGAAGAEARSRSISPAFLLCRIKLCNRNIKCSPLPTGAIDIELEGESPVYI